MSAEAERVADGDVNFSFLRLPGDKIYLRVADRVNIIEIDSRWDDGIFNSLAADNQLDSPRCAEGMTQAAFGGADGEFIGLLAENRTYGDAFGGIVKLRAGSVGVDVIDPFECDLPVGECECHSLCCAIAVRKRCGNVVAVVFSAIAEKFRVDFRVAFFCGVSFLVLSDLAAQNEESPSGVSAASDPPAIIISLLPVSIL